MYRLRQILLTAILVLVVFLLGELIPVVADIGRFLSR